MTPANKTVSWLKSENENLRSEIAYLKGKVEVYEKFLKDKGFIKEEENGQTQIQTASQEKPRVRGGGGKND